MDASYFSEIFVRLVSLARQWSAEQKKSESLFAALLEFHGRLVSLSSSNPFAPLSEEHRETLEAALPLLRAKHVRGLENILAALHKSAERFKHVRAEMGELHASLWHRHAALASEGAAQAAALDVPQWSIVGAGRGHDAQPVGLPAPTTCIEWVRDLDALYAAELIIKLEVIDALDAGASDEVLQLAARTWSEQRHLKSQPVTMERVAVLTESLTLPRQNG